MDRREKGRKEENFAFRPKFCFDCIQANSKRFIFLLNATVHRECKTDIELRERYRSRSAFVVLLEGGVAGVADEVAGGGDDAVGDS